MNANNRLADRLSEFVQLLENKRPATARAYANVVARLSGAGATSGAPRVGDILPPFRLPCDQGTLISSDELLAAGPLVVSLNRGHWCGFCLRELDALSGIIHEVQSLGGNIVAITPERQRFAKKLKAERNLDFPILSDVDNGYALSLGLAMWCGDEIKSIYTEVGFDLAFFQGNSGWLLPIPATYVVAADGRIAGSFVDADFRRRLGPEDILDLVREANN